MVMAILSNSVKRLNVSCMHNFFFLYLCFFFVFEIHPFFQNFIWYPKLDTRISSVCSFSVTLREPPLDSERGWTGDLWSNRVLLILEN